VQQFGRRPFDEPDWLFKFTYYLDHMWSSIIRIGRGI
jgi:hypothetical protein